MSDYDLFDNLQKKIRRQDAEIVFLTESNLEALEILRYIKKIVSEPITNSQNSLIENITKIRQATSNIESI